jgi:hypothetical protein
MVEFFSVRKVACAFLLLVAGCADFEESGLPGSSASLARNKMMWVREHPPTFGHYRLVSLVTNYPDMGVFIADRGMPDFLAETHHSRYEYLILYACKIPHERPRIVEFAGPYGITKKELKILNGFRTQTE